MQPLFELTRRLVDVPSITGAESAVGKVLAEILETGGFEVEFQRVDGDRQNVLAACGQPRVVLCTHMDTVGPFVPASEDDEHIYGRGSCDAKGIAAAMMMAGKQLKATGLTDFGLLFVVGEETVSDGARATTALEWPVEAVIVGEPTRNVLASGHKGALNVELTATGKAVHSGYAHLGVSAIDRLVDALIALRKMPLGDDPILGAGSLNVGVIEGGAAVNATAASARARISVRVVDSAQAAEERLLDTLAAHDGLEVTVHGASDPVQCSTLDGWHSEPVSFGTDLPYLSHFGRRFLVGPGTIHDAHTDHERVSKAELVESVGIYTGLVMSLLGGNDGD